MGDKAKTLARARKELEDLYLGGVPDESVDLSFKDLTGVQRINAAAGMAPIEEEAEPPMVNKSPSLDFAKALRGAAAATSQYNYGSSSDSRPERDQLELYRERLARSSFHRSNKAASEAADRSAYEDGVSAMSALGEPGHGKRPGIPHSNICALCSVYIYFFRHRCLVCGRVYCRNCVGMGMGEMSEGRKCVECLGKRYSQRYIKRAGQACFWRYPSRVKAQELMWAEKGPRRSNERRHRSGASSAVMLSPATSTPCGSPRVLRPASRLGSPTPGSPGAPHISISHDHGSPFRHGFPL